LAGEGLEWQVPGLRAELVLALLRALPKDLRRELVPVAEHAREFVAKARPSDGPLLQVLAKQMSAVGDVHVSPDDFDWAKVPEYLRPTFAIVGVDGQVLARGKVVTELYRQLRPQLARALQEAAARAPFTGHRSVSWDFGDLPKTFEPEWHGYRLRGYPALLDDADAVIVRVFSDEASQRASMAGGVRRLLLLNLPSRRALVDSLERQLDNRTKLALGALSLPPYRSTREMAEDVVAAAVDQVVAAEGGPPWSATAFDALVVAVRQQVEPVARKGVVAAGRIISRLQELGRRTGELSARPTAPGSPVAAALGDIAAQLAGIAGPRFVSRAGLSRFADVERYLSAVDHRLDKLPTDPRRDVALEERYSFPDAIAVATYLNIFIRNCRWVTMANLAQMVNAIAPIVTTKEGSFVQPIYYPFLMHSSTALDEAVDVYVGAPSVDGPLRTGERWHEHRIDDLGPFSVLDASATVDPDRSKLAIAIVNRAQEEATGVEVLVRGAVFAGDARVSVLTATVERPAPDIEGAKLEERSEPAKENLIVLDLPPCSFTVVEAAIAGSR
jgi:hypothetical protein